MKPAVDKGRRIIVCRKDERTECGEYTLQETADKLGLRPMTVLRMIRAGDLKAEQCCNRLQS
ncbi:hypothetical protein PY650_29045 [Rhizobium calliandrae]|uniref:DNA-binding protein n=1 Tax=Rhizobium calliandrae TaxID=1312182 RepID=A0ABT7KLT4_9HYPH|nr:hypothetical protein [Rhizobium calliandrae]